MLLTLGCKKQTTTYYIQDSFKPWTLFQKSSYWIYLNEKRNSPDSAFIENQPFSYFTPPSPATLQYEVINYTYSNCFINDAAIIAGRSSPYYALVDFFSSSHVLSAGMLDNTSNKASESCWLVERIDTLIINNNIFTNVLHTRDTNNYPPSLCVKDYYFVKNIGLIKFSIKTPKYDTTWSLVRWNVIQ